MIQKTQIKILFFSLLLIFLSNSKNSFANDVKIENLRITENNFLECTVKWENSWFFNKELTIISENSTSTAQKDFIFKDGVWCFLKIRTNDYKWKHIYLSENDVFINNQDSDTELENVEDKGGFFLSSIIREEKNGSSETSISIRLPNEIKNQFGVYDIALYAIEMVWVDEGSFFVGDGVHSQNALRKASLENDSTAVKPFLIDSENEIAVGTAANNLFGNDTEEFPQKNIPNTFPKGYDGFWIMKYEINQSQYTDFLNTLTFKQQSNRTANSPESENGTSALTSTLPLRNSIFIKVKGNQNLNIPATYEVREGKYRACNWLSAEDISAFLDWAALRPITELEFEKAARGITHPTKGEFSWGTPYIVDANTIQNDGTENETVTETANFADSAGLAPYNSGIEFNQLNGVLRNGFGAKGADFSTSEFELRLQAGASFWGVLELSGNVWEYCVKTNNTDALSFARNQIGDGTLDENGNANFLSFDVMQGFIVRGGAWDSVTYPVGDFRDLSVSARYYATLPSENRRGTTGGRGGR
ncbi:SUMF1/EgtB/PvdO family nonheme iron enzyme [Bernardetia sp.]|uniref:SUMF1/EgtB/PvdO family nonheme iron enzyme n=1 Tax=Bernardetia sp. TaxID=1937974 RepID=UPI0025BF7E62|nr:SUMF1/EgtB/PvdO family nonheme iron enzyme [Bernardetia sp.]